MILQYKKDIYPAFRRVLFSFDERRIIIEIDTANCTDRHLF